MEITSRKWNIAQRFELRWWKNYLGKKDRQHYLQWKANYWDRLLFDIEKYVDIPEHSTILDAGCGPAGIFICLKGNQVDAIDPLLDKYIENDLLETDSFPWVQFSKLSLEELNSKEKYDYIFCLNAINHVQDINKAYDGLIAALKPGGTLIISTDAHHNHFLKKIFQWIPADLLHPVQLSIEEYTNHLLNREMTDVKNILYKKDGIFHYYITIAKKP